MVGFRKCIEAFPVEVKVNCGWAGIGVVIVGVPIWRCMRLAFSEAAAYGDEAVKQPFVNAEERIDRSVGRRAAAPDSWRAGMQLQETGAQLHQSFQHRWMPKGVYRFKTHEEAEEWMIKMLARSSLPKT